MTFPLKHTMKTLLKKHPVTHYLGRQLRACQQDWIIRMEQEFYERKARQLGVVTEPPMPSLQKELWSRLQARGITVAPKSRQHLHIVYASRPVPWDEQNIVPALQKFSRVTTYFYSGYHYDQDSPRWLHIRNDMNDHFCAYILELHRADPVDLIITYYSGYEISPTIIEKLKAQGIVVCTFHLDDRLSFKGRYEGGRWTGPAAVARAYDLNLTHAPESLVKYRAEGALALLWPLAANQDVFFPRAVPFRYDVSFVGTAHMNRTFFLRYLRRRGIAVSSFGAGWPSGFVSNESVPELFSASRINLNFDNIGYTRHQCGKCRDFEIPMSGGLMLTTDNPHLSRYFEIGKDVFTFRTKGDCVRQINRLLADEPLCAAARKSAREKALRHHTWEHRVAFLLEALGYRLQANGTGKVSL